MRGVYLRRGRLFRWCSITINRAAADRTILYTRGRVESAADSTADAYITYTYENNVVRAAGEQTTKNTIFPTLYMYKTFFFSPHYSGEHAR